jgi:hypothetical protein
MLDGATVKVGLLVVGHFEIEAARRCAMATEVSKRL